MQQRARRRSAGSKAGLIEERRDRIAILTLDRPEARNGLSLALLRWLPWAWRAYSEGGLWRSPPPRPPKVPKT